MQKDSLAVDLKTLTSCRVRLAYIYRTRGNLEGSLEQIERAERDLKGFRSKNPDFYFSELAQVSIAHAEYFINAGNLQEAKKILLDWHKILLEANDTLDLSLALASAFGTLLEAGSSYDMVDIAEATYPPIMEITKRIEHFNPERSYYFAGFSKFKLGWLLGTYRRFEESIPLLDESIIYLSKAAELNEGLYDDLGNIHITLGEILSYTGEKEKAYANYQKGIEVLRSRPIGKRDVTETITLTELEIHAAEWCLKARKKKQGIDHVNKAITEYKRLIEMKYDYEIELIEAKSLLASIVALD